MNCQWVQVDADDPSTWPEFRVLTVCRCETPIEPAGEATEARLIDGTNTKWGGVFWLGAHYSMRLETRQWWLKGYEPPPGVEHK